MMAALAGTDVSFQPPSDIVFVHDPTATPEAGPAWMPRMVSEAFIAGTEPTEACELHRF